ncbi:MAG: hypothetical protein NXI31_17345 [bacterium]|nr:hypothetical protein [bacterium]
MPPTTNGPQPATSPPSDFVAGIVRLGLWFAHRELTHGSGERAARAALERRVPLLRLTRFVAATGKEVGPRDPVEWSEFCGRVTAALASSRRDVERGVAAAFGVVEPELVAVVPRPSQGSPFGCWSATVVGDGIADGQRARGPIERMVRRVGRVARRTLGLSLPEHHVELHFHNAVQPASPFGDRQGLARDLRALLGDVAARHPVVTTVWCHSWLNDRPEFLALFPSSWDRDGRVRTQRNVDVESGGRVRLDTDNWWGQFMRHDGSFHHGNAERCRLSGGELPHPNRLCHAPLAEVCTHLDDLLRSRTKEPAATTPAGERTS